MHFLVDNFVYFILNGHLHLTTEEGLRAETYCECMVRSDGHIIFSWVRVEKKKAIGCIYVQAKIIIIVIIIIIIISFHYTIQIKYNANYE